MKKVISGGMSKHRKSGVAHNHANSIQRTREFNREMEAIKLQKEKQKPKMFSSVKDVFKLSPSLPNQKRK